VLDLRRNWVLEVERLVHHRLEIRGDLVFRKFSSDSETSTDDISLYSFSWVSGLRASSRKREAKTVDVESDPAIIISSALVASSEEVNFVPVSLSPS